MDGTMATDETRAWRRRPRPAQASAIHAQYSAYRIGMREARGSVLRYLHETAPDGRTFEGALSPAGRCGVVASSDGRSTIALDCDGRCSLGVVTCADVVYEGEVDGDGTPMGYGVGSFANGHLFAGHWVTGRPEGLGQLTTALDPDASSTAGYGWYLEQRAMQLVRAPDAPTPPPDLGVRRPVEQPLLGLYIVGRVLETNRLRRCQHALGLWATRLATSARCQGGKRKDCVHGLRAKGPADPALHARLDAVLGRQRLARDRDAIRHKRTAKARQVQTTTTTCLGIERNATALMQVELDDLEAELRDARAAQARCTLIQNEMMKLRHTIEDRKVTLHALRRHHRIQPPPPRRPSSTTTLPDEPPLPLDEIAFLCGVPGCACGVPKDVFRRVGAALSGRDC
ncbi:hypothetical protein SPRG_11602 [Saprolegnia parasitica CBS 223.65]|uniref:Uncharacterized protein n=1 Tax=Saprolegnia parasitica (strain CBS 223.65) TaxID=695850 RepID=A0A067BYF5_SAPPC|nr:hypothetical protein SPRG_11602 [Saprolegnia parasitica CBS 223.65]KDO23288.1 hypothetical protein SPRG_11602 [Saprolegnia parasitica CBS 223.65]|eukprot:XP_012205942.1 hypothetical protein SPRG_11602 [Saprolegnia parasitica CBS 223.65]